MRAILCGNQPRHEPRQGAISDFTHSIIHSYTLPGLGILVCWDAHRKPKLVNWFR